MLLTKFTEELGKVNVDRSAVYGHPADDFKRVSSITAITNVCPDPELRHVLYCIAIKMCRIIFSPTHFDSWLDIAGYAKCAIMILDRRNEVREREQPTNTGSGIGSILSGGSVSYNAAVPRSSDEEPVSCGQEDIRGPERKDEQVHRHVPRTV